MTELGANAGVGGDEIFEFFDGAAAAFVFAAQGFDFRLDVSQLFGSMGGAVLDLVDEVADDSCFDGLLAYEIWGELAFAALFGERSEGVSEAVVQAIEEQGERDQAE